jgi:aryl-alcohol dehydrogenase-like predicted oxidoreductase
MRYRQFGNTGITVSEIGVGCGGLGAGRKVGLELALEYALDHGVTFFDTAVSYAEGASEQVLGRVLAGRREKVIIATKFGTVIPPSGDAYKDFSVGNLRASLPVSLQRLGTDYVDVYQLHNPPPAVLDDRRLFDELDALVGRGTIRAYGLSIDDCAAACRFLDATRGRAIQININLFKQKERPFFAEAARRSAGVIIKVPLAGGTLSGRFTRNYPPPGEERRARWGEADFARRIELVEKVRPVLEKPGRTMSQGALAWLLSFDAVSTVIPGISSLEKMQDAVGAAGMRLTAEELKTLDEMDGGAIRGLNLSW